MHNGSGIFVLLTYLPMLLYLVVIVFGIYFVIKVMKFMNTKIQLDKERNEQIEEFMKSENQSKR